MVVPSGAASLSGPATSYRGDRNRALGEAVGAVKGARAGVALADLQEDIRAAARAEFRFRELH
jgi:hypothetical protein